MDYINPATVADVQFRSMWAEFEWENKVSASLELRPVRWTYMCFDPTCSNARLPPQPHL